MGWDGRFPMPVLASSATRRAPALVRCGRPAASASPPSGKGPNRREFHAGPGTRTGADASRARSRLLLASRPVPFRWAAPSGDAICQLAAAPGRMGEFFSGKPRSAEPVELSQAGSRNQHPVRSLSACVCDCWHRANDRAMHGRRDTHTHTHRER